MSLYRKSKCSDPKSLAFQNKLEERLKDLPLLCSKKDFRKIMIMGMAACVFLLAIIAINYSKLLK
jgi:hypothetical protein